MRQPLCLFILFSLSILSPLAAQNHRAAIEETFAQYRQLSIDKDFTGLMDYIHPKLFDIVPREQLVATFEAMDNEDMSFVFKDMVIDDISDAFKADDATYALVHYQGDMQLRLLGPDFKDPAAMDLMEAQFNTLYGEDNVKVDREKAVIFIHLVKSMFAIRSAGTEGWKFIENDPSNTMLYELLIPEAVRDHFEAQK